MLTAVRVAPRPVAAGRVLLALGAALTCYEGGGFLAALQEDRVTTPVADGLLSADAVPLGLWVVTMAAACLLLALGVLAPACTITIAAGNILLMAADHQLYSNHRFLLVVLCLVFAVAQSERAWALGARARREAGDGLVRWWPQLLVVATVSACYLFAGLSKANPEFLSGDLIRSLAPAWVPAQVAAWATVPTEIAIGLGIWWRPARRFALGTGVLLHLSIIALLGAPLVFTAFALLCLAAYPLVLAMPRLDQEEAAAIHRSSVA
ncbi:MAG TPA: HTTM domain-containing protein [Nocardioides sp.]|nr:HTTM domain-containing protein [Nocardioides sp.]